MANELRISIGGDASSFARAAGRVVESTERIRNSFQDAASATPKVEASFIAIEKRMEILQKRLQSLQNVASNTSDFGKLNKAIDLIHKTQSELNSLGKISPPPLGKIAPGAERATTALTNLSRVAQDAPFGFIAIANNLDPLFDSFARLQKETGGTGAALKALAGSLAGPAGIGIALAITSSLITVAIQKYGSLGAAIDALFGGLTNAAQAQRDLSKAFAQAEGGAAGEVANLNSLLSVARDETLSKKARLQAINELNQEYDKFLPKLTLENIKTKETQESVDKLTSSLVRQAKIKGAQDLISKETTKQLELFSASISDNATFLDNVVAALKGPANFGLNLTIQGAERTGKEFKLAEERIKLFNKALQELTKEEAINGTLFQDKEKKDQDLLGKRLALLEKIRSLTLDVKTKTDLSEQIADVKLKINARDLSKGIISSAEAEIAKRGIQDELNKAFQAEALSLEGSARIKITNVERVEIPEKVTDKISKAVGVDRKIPVPVDFDIDVKLRGQRFAELQREIGKIIDDLNTAIKNTISTGLTDAFSGVGEQLGAAIAQGDFTGGIINAVKGVVGIIGSVVQSLGKSVIQAATAILIAKKTIQKFIIANPALALAAGVGLVALGSLLKNIVVDVPKLAQGGIATSATLGIFGEKGREAIIPLDKLPSLLGRINDAGNLSVTLVPTIRFSMNDFIVGFERGNEKRRRLG